ncbi:MAG: SHOCT domain-containing protein [Clostridia bacterium]|nr:SHOCT domain-containing protein [Clostridia bacterium]
MINSAFNQIFKVALYLVALVIALIFALAVGILSTKVLKSKRKIVALISSIVIAIVAIIASLMCIIIIISAFSLLRYIFGGYFETTYVIALIYSYFASPLINIGMCLTLVASAVLAFLMIPSSKGDKDSAPTATEAPKAEEKSEAAPVAREEMAAPATVEGGSNQNDVFDVIMKYKKLYEAGAITEEEFLSKKKQLMGL